MRSRTAGAGGASTADRDVLEVRQDVAVLLREVQPDVRGQLIETVPRHCHGVPSSREGRNKRDDPRAWALESGTAEALRWWRDLVLANGRGETWVMDRTGHCCSHMANRYRRVARSVVELGLGPLTPLHEAIPEGKGAGLRPKSGSIDSKET
jgi:hypothetical protein